MNTLETIVLRLMLEMAEAMVVIMLLLWVAL